MGVWVVPSPNKKRNEFKYIENMPKIISQDKKIQGLTLLLKEKEQEVRIAKQKAGFFARKYAESLEKAKKV